MHARRTILLILILVLAAALRLVQPGETPPGMHVDAAGNAWNTRCLLDTGTDWRGDPWPVFYSRAFGENVPTLYYYTLLPFQALFGMSEASTTLPSAFAGVLAVLATFAIGRRLYGADVGLWAAGFLAVTPWSVFLGRWGHESGLVPLQIVGPIAAMLWAGLPLGVQDASPARGWRGAVAGAMTGVACYGYFAVRMFLPLMLAGAIAVQAPAWLAALRDRRTRLTVVAFGVALALVAGPLFVEHLTDPSMSKRGGELLVWGDGDSLTDKALAAAGRYPGHFSPRFLFDEGDTWPTHRLPASGQLGWYLLPVLLAGAFVVTREARVSPAARVLAVWVLLYPVPDLVMTHPGPHALRSAPGLPGLLLVAALGSVRAGEWLRARDRRLARAGAVLLLAAVLGFGGRFARVFFGEYTRDAAVRHAFNADLLEASRWVRPRLDEVDAVFFSCRDSAAFYQPFVLTLVGLDYEPARWFAEPVEVEPRADTDLYKRYGKVHFLFDDGDVEALRRLERNGTPDRVLLVLRPGEWRETGRTPVHRIRHPDGRVAFVIFDERL